MDPVIWRNLPQTLLESVFACLPLNSIIQLQLLSKHWHTHITSPAFQHALNQNRFQTIAVVMDSERANPKKVWAYDFMAGTWNGIPFQSLPFSYLVAANGGLLCFVKYTRCAEQLQVLVCNPLTRAWRELPPLLRLQAIPKAFLMVVDIQERQYTIKSIDDLNAREPIVHVYNSKTNLWDRGLRNVQRGAFGRYLLVDCCHGSIHTVDIHPESSIRVLLPPDFDHDSVAQDQGFSPVGDQNYRFLLRTHGSENMRDPDSKNTTPKWRELCRVPRANDLEDYFFSVLVDGEIILLLGERRRLYYGSLDDEVEDNLKAEDENGSCLMLMYDMSTRIWREVTDSRVEPGCPSTFIFRLQLTAVP